MKPLTEPKPPQEVPIAEAIKLAAALHQNGEREDAEKLYRRILEVEPDQPDALNFLGVLTFQQGDAGEAIRLIRRSIEVAPDLADARNNLGNILRSQGQLEEACQEYQRAVELDPENAGSRHNYACALTAEGRYEKALEHFLKAIDLIPQHTDAYRRAGQILYLQGRLEEAVHLYRQWLKQDPDHPIAAHMLAACSGVDPPPRASDDYIQRVFDTFSESFDQVLERLDYRAPELIAEAIGREVGGPRGALQVLDVGCGTGLCGPLLKPYAERLVGVDLSRGMLDKARERGAHHELVQAELTAFLAGHAADYDVIVSADTLCYLGELEPVFLAAARALRPGGHFAFTVEEADASEVGSGFVLNPYGRYAHTASYLEEALSAASLGIVSMAGREIRSESRRPVRGLVVVCSV